MTFKDIPILLLCFFIADIVTDVMWKKIQTRVSGKKHGER